MLACSIMLGPFPHFGLIFLATVDCIKFYQNYVDIHIVYNVAVDFANFCVINDSNSFLYASPRWRRVEEKKLELLRL